VNTEGTVTPIYSAQKTMTLTATCDAGVSDCWAEVRHPQGAGWAHFTTTRYYHGDHLGSSRLMTAYEGFPIWEATYLPYGQEHAAGGAPPLAPGGQHYKFTGKERDAESGLDYMGARYYTSLTGRFISPDLPGMDQHLTNPQTLNLYVYARNNPLAYTDPTGNVAESSMPFALTARCESNGGQEAAPTVTIDVETTLESPTAVGARILAYINGGGNPLVAAMAIQIFNQVYAANQGTTGRQIAKTATANVGSTEYLVAKRKGSYAAGTNKCNGFVADMIEESGLPRPQVPYENIDGGYMDLAKRYFGRDPSAHEWADPNVSIAGWSAPMPVSQARPGDVIAQGHGRFGHVGIVVAPGLTVSANTAKNPPGIVTQNNWGFRPRGQNGERAGDFAPVVRRYLGR
jgi:RHS repeat-associated protein